MCNGPCARVGVRTSRSCLSVSTCPFLLSVRACPPVSRKCAFTRVSADLHVSLCARPYLKAWSLRVLCPLAIISPLLSVILHPGSTVVRSRALLRARTCRLTCDTHTHTYTVSERIFKTIPCSSMYFPHGFCRFLQVQFKTL